MVDKDSKMKVYIDTNIYLDQIWDREDNLRPIGIFAHEFFVKGWRGDFVLVFSNWVEKELRNHISEEEINGLLKDFEEVIHIKYGSDDWSKAKKYEHPDDALHALLANKAGADYLVTRNFKHYSDCKDLVKLTFPEAF